MQHTPGKTVYIGDEKKTQPNQIDTAVERGRDVSKSDVFVYRTMEDSNSPDMGEEHAEGRTRHESRSHGLSNLRRMVGQEWTLREGGLAPTLTHPSPD